MSQVRRVSSSDSMGIKTSTPNAKVYDVSPVDYFGVVRYAKSIGSLSTHFPFADVNLFFRYPSNGLFVILDWPLDWGYIEVWSKRFLFHI